MNLHITHICNIKRFFDSLAWEVIHATDSCLTGTVFNGLEIGLGYPSFFIPHCNWRNMTSTRSDPHTVPSPLLVTILSCDVKGRREKNILVHFMLLRALQKKIKKAGSGETSTTCSLNHSIILHGNNLKPSL